MSIINNTKKNIVRRKTNQRDLVLEAICDGQHASAGDIFEIVSRTRQMSFGTVYRNLQILEEESKISSIKASPDLLHYDRRLDPHHNLHCTKCGKIFDVPLAYQVEFDTEVEQKSGFHIDSHSITFEGLCCDCQNCMKTA